MSKKIDLEARLNTKTLRRSIFLVTSMAVIATGVCCFLSQTFYPIGATLVSFGAGWSTKRLCIWIERVKIATSIAIDEDPPEVIANVEALKLRMDSIRRENHDTIDVEAKVKAHVSRRDDRSNETGVWISPEQLEGSRSARSNSRRRSNR